MCSPEQEVLQYQIRQDWLHDQSGCGHIETKTDL